MTATAQKSLLIAAVLFFAGVVLLAINWAAWPWATIGGLVALAGLVIILLRDQIMEYGKDFKNAKGAEIGWRSKARALHPFVYAIGLPLVLLSAIYQVVGNPADHSFIHHQPLPNGVVFTPTNSDPVLDLPKLDTALQVLESNQQRFDSALKAGQAPALLVVNCGLAANCACPKGYRRVPDTGKWDLNAGVKADRITLCQRESSP
jgi:hypothetical protein